MTQPELHQPSWLFNSSTIDSSDLDEVGFRGLDMDTDMGNYEFSPSFLSIAEDSSEVSASIPYISAVYYDDHQSHRYPGSNENLQVPMSPIDHCLLNLDESGISSNEKLSFEEVEGLFNWMGIENDPPSQEFCVTEENEASADVSSAQKPLIFLQEDTELDSQLSNLHLLKACGEAMENQQKELVEVILRRLEEKACLKGSAVQRLVCYLIQALDGHLDYLTEEASKNYTAAFRAFYQIFPYGRFAHFVANSAILEAVPEDAEIVHIVDFDMGEGVQWPPLIEALGKQSQQRAMRLISIKCQDYCNSVPPLQSFEQTKKLLNEHAYSSGLRLKIEEMDMEGLVSEMKKMKRERGGREWLAFNCMAGLPHMGRWRSSRHVTEFLKIAQESINTRKESYNGTSNRGIITFGDGDGAEETTSDCCGFGSFFEGRLGCITALLESMEWQIPLFLREARMAMECLFVAPYVSTLACFEKLEEDRAWRSGLLPMIGLDAFSMSKDTIAEAKELVREGDSLYWIKTDGENENQAVLSFEGTPLVRVSCWS